MAQNRPTEALTLLLDYLKEVNDIRYPMLIAEINNTISKAYWKLNDIGNAKIHAKAAQKANKNLQRLDVKLRNLTEFFSDTTFNVPDDINNLDNT